MWKCQKCGERLEDTYESCWSCGTGKDGSTSENSTPFQEGKKESTENQQQSTTESEEYICTVCDAQVTEEDSVCPSCGTDISEIEYDGGTLVESLSTRYSDAYTEAHAVTAVGKVVKGVGAFLLVGILIVGFAMASELAGRGEYVAFVVVGFVLACFLGVPVYVLGIFVAAQGQTQLARLDTAVNSCRHLKDDDVAQILAKRFSL